MNLLVFIIDYILSTKRLPYWNTNYSEDFQKNLARILFKQGKSRIKRNIARILTKVGNG
jgi:ribosomal protein L29